MRQVFAEIERLSAEFDQHQEVWNKAHRLLKATLWLLVPWCVCACITPLWAPTWLGITVYLLWVPLVAVAWVARGVMARRLTDMRANIAERSALASKIWTSVMGSEQTEGEQP